MFGIIRYCRRLLNTPINLYPRRYPKLPRDFFNTNKPFDLSNRELFYRSVDPKAWREKPEKRDF